MKFNTNISNATLKRTGVDNNKSYLYKQILAIVASCLISLCGGLTFGISGVMLPQLREDKSIQYDASYDSWIASSASLAMAVGPMGCGPILDTYGRKAAHIILGIPFIIGWTFIACANNTTFLFVGRIFTGLSTGVNKAVTLVYIGEISDPKIRTAALFLPGLAGHIGIVFSHVVGHFLPWNITAIVCLIPAILACITFLFLKESPMWLIAKGRIEEGIETFRWFRGTDDASELELKLLLERQNDKPKLSTKETLKAACRLSFLKPMILLTILMVNVQFSGVNVLIFYSQDIFEQVISKSIDAFMLTAVMDSFRVIIALFICLLGKWVPKRNVFLISNFGVSVFVFGLVACLMADFNSSAFRISCLLMFIIFSSSIVTIGWTFVPELLPNSARGFGSGLNSTITFFSLFLIVKFTPDIMSAYGVSAFFGFCGISTLVLGLILVFFLPETSGKTLQSIEDSYTKNDIEQTHL